MKHIVINFHFVWDKFANGQFKVSCLHARLACLPKPNHSLNNIINFSGPKLVSLMGALSCGGENRLNNLNPKLSINDSPRQLVVTNLMIMDNLF